LSISGIPPLIYLNFAVGEPMEVQTFYAQEMLKKGYLVGGAIYTTYAYSRPILDRFLTDTDSVFSRVRRHLDEGGLAKHLEGDIIQTGFRRLA
jgi:hypothetical protein